VTTAKTDYLMADHYIISSLLTS